MRLFSKNNFSCYPMLFRLPFFLCKSYLAHWSVKFFRIYKNNKWPPINLSLGNVSCHKKIRPNRLIDTNLKEKQKKYYTYTLYNGRQLYRYYEDDFLI